MQKNGQLEEGLLVLVDDLSYWEYDRAEIEYAIKLIPFNKNLIEVLVDTQCHCLNKSCFFTDDANETLETSNNLPSYKYHDLNSELFIYTCYSLLDTFLSHHSFKRNDRNT